MKTVSVLITALLFGCRYKVINLVMPRHAVSCKLIPYLWVKDLNSLITIQNLKL